MFRSFFFVIRQKSKAVLAAALLVLLLTDSFFGAAAAADSLSDAAIADNFSGIAAAEADSGAAYTAPDPTLPLTDGGPDISSASAVVMDIRSGAVLYAKNQLEAHQPSSLTKLVTTLVCMENLSPGSTLAFSSAAASQDFPTASNAGYLNGDTTTVGEALTAMVMCSADDCAYALAEKAKGSMTAFAEAMNDYAAENGFLNSSFINSYGRHAEGHYTCAYDMAAAAARVMNTVPEFKSAASGTSAALSASGSSLRELTVKNTHRFINGADSYSYCYAGKTGGTAYGGDGTWSLCTFASYKGLDLVCIIMGAPSNDSTYADTKLLLDFAFENFEAVSASSFISSSAEGIGTLFNNDLLFHAEDISSVFVDPDAVLVLPKNADTSTLVSKVSLTQIHEYLYGNNVIGRIDFSYGDRNAGSADILFYTENASMPQSEFNRYFPSFLINPESNQGDNIYSEFDSEDAGTEKPGFFGKIKAGIYSLYTPAKSFAAVVSVFIFFIGLLVIFLIFPVETKHTDVLYTKEYNECPPHDYGDELSEVRTVRSSDVDDMHEVR